MDGWEVCSLFSRAVERLLEPEDGNPYAFAYLIYTEYAFRGN